ncbi:MAG: CCA tRNA nucleotidyltransferase [Bacilli bacterium]
MSFEIGNKIIATLTRAGYEAYFVGGCVRDSVIGRPIGDIDLTTRARPETVVSLFERTIPTGLQHGTVTVLLDGTTFEVTTYRTESTYADHRRPDEVTYVETLEEDLARRDFTMNSIAMSADRQMIDPFDGLGAIRRREIVTVGEADARFDEDALRMVRAFRFQSQLNFTLHPDILVAVRKLGERLRYIAAERIHTEWNKLLVGEAAHQSVQMMRETGLFAHFPGAEFIEEGTTWLAEESQKPNLSLEEMWVALAYHVPKNDLSAFCRALKTSNAFCKSVVGIHEALRNTSKWTPYSVYRTGIDAAISAERVRTVRESGYASGEETVKAIWEALPITGREQLQLSGHDLMQATGRKPGPWLKTIIEEAERGVVEGRLANDRTKLTEWGRTNVSE